jgi:hypothetical protein
MIKCGGIMTRSKMKAALIILFLFCFFLAIACEKQKTLWKGTMQEENGVTVVRNPKEPMYGEDVFILEEELSIGQRKGDGELLFLDARSLSVDEDGRIYVFDFKEANVKVFDSNGNYIRTFGKKGQGPGELNLPLAMSITSQNEIVVEDFRNKLVCFSSEGEFIKSIPITKLGVSGVVMDSQGNIVGLGIVREKEDPRYEVKKFDSDLNYLHSLGSSPLPSATPGGFNPFRGVIRYNLYSADQIICGYPEKYEIKIYDNTGELKKTIMKDYDPVEITEEEIKEQTEGMPPDIKISISKYHPAYRRFSADDEGRIFVRTYERIEEAEGYYYDVFDAEGRFILKIPLIARPHVIKNDQFYTIEEDEEGYQVVKRYKVVWKLST